MQALKIFLVEDDPFFGEVIKYHLMLNPDYTVTLFQTGKECLEKLFLKPDIVCLDFGLPDISGDVLLKKILQINNTVSVIMISGQED
ncbi:MAG: response regulator, partial [Flavobacterium sp.]|nr:response regulator [Flavobacterium sp.]